MKTYLTEWKRWKSVLIENVQAAQDALKTAQEKQKKINDYADMMKKQSQQEVSQAQAEVAAAQAEEKVQQQQDEMQQASQPATSGTTGTSLPKMEESGMRPEGTVGKQPGDHQDVPNANMEEELTEQEVEEASGCHEGLDEAGKPCNLELQYEEVEEQKQCNECRDCTMCGLLTEAKYKGKKVPLGKPMRGDVKKFKVYVRDPKTGNVKKVNFGDKKMRIKKSNPARRRSFRARHNCANPGPRTKARYWSCRKW
jgi:hypothetical protein